MSAELSNSVYSSRGSLNVCMFGIYDPNYSRNKILRQGLSDSGCEVTECFVDPKTHGRFTKYVILAKKYLTQPQSNFDVVLVAFPGPTVVWLAKLLFRGPIIYDAFISFYDSLVFDRKVCSSNSVRGRWNHFLDWYSTRLADLCLFDTEEHTKLFQQLYNVPKQKCIRVFIGVDTSTFVKSDEGQGSTEKHIVHFHGSFIPLQGIKYILDAATYLAGADDVLIRIVGGDPVAVEEYREEVRRRGLDNLVQFTGRASQEDVIQYIREATITLGVFGDTPKTQRVIPNKVFECAALGKPIITADTPAIREAFSDGENIVLCRHADGESLAEAIMALLQDTNLQHRIGEGAYALVEAELTPHRVVQPLVKALENL